jgi:glycosyltransferase involved in cell wall biosynthesis
MKVAVVSIAKNEEQFVKRWKESAQDADALYILDTGSSDNTVSIAKELGINTYTADIQPWHFGNARNFLLDMLPDDIDWIINLDLDEVLIDGWRAELEKVANNGSITRVRYKYIWSWNPDGTPGVTYHGDKIVRRHSHRWKGACHEVNTVQPGYEELQTFCELQIHHHADNTKSRSSYLPLLLLDVEEDPENDRNVYYCARELFFAGRVEEAVAMFKRHLGLKSAVWAPERAWSMRYLAKLLPEEAEHWHLRACAEYPAGAEVWTDLASFYHSKAQWPGCFYAATQALNCTYSGNLYLTEPNAYGWWPNDLAALAAYQIGSYHLALKYGQTAVDLNPTDQRLKDNLIWYKKASTTLLSQ